MIKQDDVVLIDQYKQMLIELQKELDEERQKNSHSAGDSDSGNGIDAKAFIAIKRHDGTTMDRTRLLLELIDYMKQTRIEAVMAGLRWDPTKQRFIQRKEDKNGEGKRSESAAIPYGKDEPGNVAYAWTSSEQ